MLSRGIPGTIRNESLLKPFNFSTKPEKKSFNSSVANQSCQSRRNVLSSCSNETLQPTNKAKKRTKSSINFSS